MHHAGAGEPVVLLGVGRGHRVGPIAHIDTVEFGWKLASDLQVELGEFTINGCHIPAEKWI